MFNRKTVKQLRLDRGLDPRELGLLVGVSERTMWRYESGTFEPQFSTAERIADVLGVSLDDLRAPETACTTNGASRVVAVAKNTQARAISAKS